MYGIPSQQVPFCLVVRISGYQPGGPGTIWEIESGFF